MNYCVGNRFAYLCVQEINVEEVASSSCVRPSALLALARNPGLDRPAILVGIETLNGVDVTSIYVGCGLLTAEGGARTGTCRSIRRLSRRSGLGGRKLLLVALHVEGVANRSREAIGQDIHVQDDDDSTSKMKSRQMGCSYLLCVF